MKKIIYSKFSNERREEFQIRTDIVMDDSVNERKVYKSAIYEGGKKHLLHISDAYKKLSETYIQKNIVFCESNLVDNMLESPYIAGETLQQILETAVGNNDEKLIVETGIFNKKQKIVPLYRIVNITARDNIFNFGELYINDKGQTLILKNVKHSKDEMTKLITKWENAKKENIRNEVI